jgi:hypothetical protein
MAEYARGSVNARLTFVSGCDTRGFGIIPRDALP